VATTWKSDRYDGSAANRRRNGKNQPLRRESGNPAGGGAYDASVVKIPERLKNQK